MFVVAGWVVFLCIVHFSSLVLYICHLESALFQASCIDLYSLLVWGSLRLIPITLQCALVSCFNLLGVTGQLRGGAYGRGLQQLQDCSVLLTWAGYVWYVSSPVQARNTSTLQYCGGWVLRWIHQGLLKGTSMTAPLLTSSETGAFFHSLSSLS